MAETTEQMLTLAAGDPDDLSLSMRQVLDGFFTEVGGAREFGRQCAKLFTSPETSAASKVSTAANMMKMVGLYGEEDGSDDLLPDAMIERYDKLRSMERRLGEAHAG